VNFEFDNNTYSILNIILVFSIPMQPCFCFCFFLKKGGEGLAHVITMFSTCVVMHEHMYEGLFLLLSICPMKSLI